MLGNRTRGIRPAMVLWLLVVVADTAAVGRAAMLVYLLTGVVAVSIVLAAAAAVTGRDRMAPQPVRVRARNHRR